MTQASDFIVGCANLRDCSLVEAPLSALAEDEVLLKIDRFAFTSNNVTYAAFGEAMHYWDFFPAPQGFGKVPVWGFVDVAESRHSGIAVGERVFGYFPMSTHLVVKASQVKPGSFVDALKHSCVVGGTHWEARDGGGVLPGPKRQFFFAPTQIAKRNKERGPGGIETRFADA